MIEITLLLKEINIFLLINIFTPTNYHPKLLFQFNITPTHLKLGAGMQVSLKLGVPTSLVITYIFKYYDINSLNYTYHTYKYWLNHRKQVKEKNMLLNFSFHVKIKLLNI